MSDERTPKAHRPSQSGKKAEKKAKGKDKHNALNDKVGTWSSLFYFSVTISHLL
jgi:hypothetical protein